MLLAIPFDRAGGGFRKSRVLVPLDFYHHQFRSAVELVHLLGTWMCVTAIIDQYRFACPGDAVKLTGIYALVHQVLPG